MAVTARLNGIWQSNSIGFASKLSSPSSFMVVKYGPWLLSLRKKDPGFWRQCLRNFSASPTWSIRPMTGCEARSTSLWVHRNIWQLSRDGNLHGLGMSHASLSKITLKGILEGDGWHGWQKKCWMDNIKEWISLPMPALVTRASCRKDRKRISAESSVVSPQWPNRSRDWIELKDIGDGLAFFIVKQGSLWSILSCLLVTNTDFHFHAATYLQ